MAIQTKSHDAADRATRKKCAAWPPPESKGWTEKERSLTSKINPEHLPRHVAIIMDGNGRWASQHGSRERIRGHEAGVESVREITRACGILGIEVLTLYAFSKENWRRPQREVAALMRLLEQFLVAERSELMDNGVRLRSIGHTPDLPDSVQATLRETTCLTENNKGLILNLALSYGARDEILRAVRKAAEQAVQGALDPARIDEKLFSDLLDTADFPDPDLLIRTSGEMRVSNFLLWQIAYAELYVTPVLWPDFRRLHLLEALLDFQGRDRRFGRTRPASAQTSEA